VVKTRGIVLVSVHGVFQAIVVVLEPCRPGRLVRPVAVPATWRGLLTCHRVHKQDIRRGNASHASAIETIGMEKNGVKVCAFTMCQAQTERHGVDSGVHLPCRVVRLTMATAKCSASKRRPMHCIESMARP